MTEQPREPRSGRFAARRGSPSELRLDNDRENLRALLDDVDAGLERVALDGRSAFTHGSDSYAHGSLAIIHLATALERDEYTPYLMDIGDGERRGLVTTRNIIAHSGYKTMNNDQFWDTLTLHAPLLVQKVRNALAD